MNENNLGPISTVDLGAKSIRKRILIGAVAVIVVGGVVTSGILIFANKGKTAAQTATYREYTVEKGDVTAGTTETGTVTLDRATVSFPVNATIQTVQVKSGYEVKQGDALVQLDPASVEDGTADIKIKLSEAKVALQQAVAEQKTKLAAAKLTLEASKALASNAPVENSIAVSDIQKQIEDAQKKVTDTQTQLTEYQALQKSYPTDYAKLTELLTLRDNVKKYKAEQETLLSDYKTANNAILSKYDSLKSSLDKAKSAVSDAEVYLNSLASDSSDKTKATDALTQAQTVLTQAQKAYDYYWTTAQDVVAGKESIEDMIEQYTNDYDKYSEQYDEFKATYDKKYKVAGDELDDKVDSLTTDLATAKYNLDKLQKQSGQSEQDADQKLASNLNTASSAQSTYELTVLQLSQAVEAKQTSYDTLQAQMDELQSAIASNGLVTAPCDGTVVSVGYTDGADVQANQTIVTIAKSTGVSMALSLAEEDITSIKVGQTAEMTLTAYEGETFPATVDSITTEPARSGSASVTYTVTVKMTGDNTKQVYEGMSGEVTLIQDQKKDVLYISNRAVTFKDGASTVLLKGKDGKGVKTTITTGFSNGTYVEVTSGLQEGDTVMVESAVTAK